MNIETANRLLSYRKKFNLSQEELAAKIGVSRQAISKWERAEASPDTDNLILLADIYGVTLDELLKGESGKSKDTQNNSANNSEDCTDNGSSTDEKADENEIKYEKADKISFKNGIHVDSRDGDHVHLSFTDGIHIKDNHGTNVNIDWDGINVEENGKQRVYTDENGNVMYDKSMKNHHRCNAFNKFPFFIIAIIAFLCWGFSGVCFGWALSWICFLTIPLYYTLGDAIFKRNPNHFAYPVLTVIVYMLFGYFNVCGGWSTGWTVFLTIPIYYWVCSLFKDENNENDYVCTED